MMGNFEKCKCCLKDGELRDMWAYNVNDEGAENYGKMLNDCFALTLQESTEYSEKICKSCIKRLRDALSFKMEVIFSKEVLDDIVEMQESGNVKEEKSDSEILNQEWLEDEEEVLDCSQDENLPDNDEHLPDTDEHLPDEEMQVEYLEHDEDARKLLGKKQQKNWRGKHLKYKDVDLYSAVDMVRNNQMTMNEASAEYDVPVKTLRSKLKENAPSRKYTDEDLNSIMDMVLTNQINRNDASAKYNIPIKVLRAKLREKEAKEEGDIEKFNEEIRMILKYTNATPFKSKIHTFFCAYCSTDGPPFEDPVLLRIHTRSRHEKERLDINKFMKPYHLNEVHRFDIENLHCTKCKCPIEDWNAMFTHLQEQHAVELNQAYTKAIPYILKEDISCVLCCEKQSHYHKLDIHMNAHYDNYICGMCGETYLSKSRLKTHLETHSSKKFPCPRCDRVFSLLKYRRRHYERVHMEEQKFQCKFCTESFAKIYERHLHALSKHKEKIKSIKCEYCDMKFTWRPYYFRHIKLKHKIREKKFKCKLCSKNFHMKHELRNHEEWHRGEGFTCPVCNRKFSSKTYLRKHILTHTNDSEVIVIVKDEGRNEV